MAAGQTRMTLAGLLAAYLMDRPNTWVDGRELAQVGGSYAWRTRLSDIRRAPFLMDIENRQRRIVKDGRRLVVSEYRWRPNEAAAGAPTPAAV